MLSSRHTVWSCRGSIHLALFVFLLKGPRPVQLSIRICMHLLQWRMLEEWLNGYPGPSGCCCCFSVGTSKACHDHYIADAQSWLLVFSEMQSNQHYVPVLYPASPPECSKVYRGQEPERLYPGLFQLLNTWSHNALIDFLVAPEQMEGMDSRSSQVVGDAGFHFHHFCRFA